MRVVTGREMAALDARARDEYGLSGLVLMENAGGEVARFIARLAGSVRCLAFVCGPGNNGGDGLVAARHLALSGYTCEIWLTAGEADYRGDAAVNLKAAESLGLTLRWLPAEEALFAAGLRQADVIVDAVFGTGFQGPPRPAAAEVLRLINAAGRPVIAVDIPSGVEADTGAVPGEAVRADYTVTFALPKLGCLLYPGAGHCGALTVAPISLPVPAAMDAGAIYRTEAEDLRPLLPHRSREAHKGQSGRVLIIGGSAGLTGAPLLAASGALRAGAGLVTVLLPEGVPIAEKPMEIMTATLPGGKGGEFTGAAAAAAGPWLARADAIAIGPGMGQGEGAWELLAEVMRVWKGPLILDADALNLLAKHPAALASPGTANRILTPHPGEMARLTGTPLAEIQAGRVAAARRAAASWQAVVALKGVPTVVAWPDGPAWLNPTGDPAMATGGMGDVLSGLLAALAGQGMQPGDAAVAAVYLHGLAGEIAAAANGGPGILASEVAGAIPAAIRKVKEGCPVTRS